MPHEQMIVVHVVLIYMSAALSLAPAPLSPLVACFPSQKTYRSDLGIAPPVPWDIWLA